LNRYPDLKAYALAKLNIVKNRKPGHIFLYNGADPYLSSLVDSMKISTARAFRSVSGEALYSASPDGIFSGDRLFIPADRIYLKGMHNYENILAAVTIGHELGVADDVMAKAVSTFKGIPHRMEFVGEFHGVKYYNDSKATNVASAVAGIRSFSGNLILILGGQLKGAPQFEDVYSAMEGRVKSVLCYGEAGEIMAGEIQNRFPSRYVEDFSACVMKAMDMAEPGDTVLLCPACASFDQFDNFEVRGERFIQLVTLMEDVPV
jgi:UDP-N-acetylmuramoylalanine--D-glutamate ligase